MSYKKWLFSGIIIFVGSLLLGFLGMIWGIHNAFDALRTNETAGIGQVGVGIETALISTVVSIIGIIIGLVLIIFGIVKAKQNKDFSK